MNLPNTVIILPCNFKFQFWPVLDHYMVLCLVWEPAVSCHQPELSECHWIWVRVVSTYIRSMNNVALEIVIQVSCSSQPQPAWENPELLLSTRPCVLTATTAAASPDLALTTTGPPVLRSSFLRVTPRVWKVPWPCHCTECNPNSQHIEQDKCRLYRKTKSELKPAQLTKPKC